MLSMVSKRRDCITKQIVVPWLVGLVSGSSSNVAGCVLHVSWVLVCCVGKDVIVCNVV